MKLRRTSLSALTLLAALASPASRAQAGAPVKDDAAVRKALEDEMARATQKLRLGNEVPPYYVSFRVSDEDRTHVAARLGALVSDDHNPTRSLSVDMRVGSYAEDNTRGGSGGKASGGISRDDDYTGLRRDLWELSDREYKTTLEAMALKKASKSVESADKDTTPDFAQVSPTQSVTDKATVPSDVERVRVREAAVKLSEVFREFPAVNDARVDAAVSYTRRRFLTNEKTWTDERRSRVRIDVNAEAATPDGRRLHSSATFSAADVASLPTLEKMVAEVKALATNLVAQRSAAAVEAGSASVVFEGQAAAQLARMMFAQALSGRPEPKSADMGPRDGSMSFAEKIGLRVAPTWLTVTDDPSALGATKKPLAGSYDTDDEGVPGEKLTLVDHGVVKTLFMSRAPRKELPRSNGHGRGTWSVRAGASNLFLRADGGLARPLLLAAATRSAGPKGTVYIVRQLDPSSGLGRGQTLNARVAFRLKAGKEEPVRDLSLEGFVLKKMKKDLIAAGNDAFLLEDDTGATSVTSPSLLFEDVDVGKPNDKNRIPPLYPSPLEAGVR